MTATFKELIDTENNYIEEKGSLSKSFLNSSTYSVLSDIPEILCEWWSYSKKNIHTFLEDENLSQFISDETFVNILLGKHYFSNIFLLLLKEKIPNNITLQRLYALNKKFTQIHPSATKLKINKELIFDFLKERYTQKKAAKQARKTQKRLKNINEILVKERKYGKTYREKNRDKINKTAREKYYENLEENRKKNAAKQKSWREKNRDKINENRDKINERRRERYREDLIENRQKVADYRKKHRDKINERRRERYHENLIENKQKVADYRKKHRDEINKKQREDYQKNLEKNRQRFAKYLKEHRDEINERRRNRYHENLDKRREKNKVYKKNYTNKKRFQTKTSKMIFPLLAELIQSKRQK